MEVAPLCRSRFDAVTSLSCSMHEYVLRYALVAQRRAPEICDGYRLAYARATGWRLEYAGAVVSAGDAGRVHDVVRRTPMNYFIRAGHELRAEAAAQGGR